MRTNILFCVTTILMATTTALPQVQQTALQTELARLERQFGGHLGVMAKDLTTGDSVTYNGDERFPTASVIKLPIMAAFFHEVDAKTLDPGQMITLTAEDKKEGSGILQYLSDGATISLLDAVKLMIVLSDNSATNLVLDHLASTHPERLKVVNDFLQSSGLTQTTLLNRLVGQDRFEVNAVREYDGKGRHTTARRQLIVLDEGALLIDTPGMRELGNIGASRGIAESFSDVGELSRGCRFADCTHTTEIGCSLLAALENGELSQERYQSYLSLLKESE